MSNNKRVLRYTIKEDSMSNFQLNSRQRRFLRKLGYTKRVIAQFRRTTMWGSNGILPWVCLNRTPMPDNPYYGAVRRGEWAYISPTCIIMIPVSGDPEERQLPAKY
jgi:hypothetical protein